MSEAPSIRLMFRGDVYSVEVFQINSEEIFYHVERLAQNGSESWGLRLISFSNNRGQQPYRSDEDAWDISHLQVLLDHYYSAIQKEQCNA